MQVLENKTNEIVLNEEQESIKKLIEETDNHIFITGKAGTGKSTLLKAIRESTSKECVVAAPTGVAAINVDGQTIHSLFQLPLNYDPDEEIEVSEKTKKVLRKIDMVILDEISMVRVDLIDSIDQVLRIARETSLPFGGVQIVMFGDLYQLPPVVADENLHKYLKKQFGGIYFFNANVWKQTEFIKHELQTIFRQADEGFKDILNSVREGECSVAHLYTLNKRTGGLLPTEGLVTLTSTNKRASEINEYHLNKLPGEIFTFEASISSNFDKSAYPTEPILRLKAGAQVMLVKNDSDSRWVNGTIAIIKEVSNLCIKVEIEGEVHSLDREEWKKKRYSYNARKNTITQEEEAKFVQYPIKLAWAMTIHKSQGKTLDCALIDLGYGAFAPGQVYVALSRCKSLSGVYLKQVIRPKDIITDPNVIKFMKGKQRRKTNDK